MKTLSLLLLLTLSGLASADEEAAQLLDYHDIDFKDQDRLLWNNSKTAFAYCFDETPSKCFIVDAEYAVDVSSMEFGNLGKLGLYAFSAYDRIQTSPESWLKSEDGVYLVLFKTHAWRNGQRYTVQESTLAGNGVFHGR